MASCTPIVPRPPVASASSADLRVRPAFEALAARPGAPALHLILAQNVGDSMHVIDLERRQARRCSVGGSASP